MQAHSLSPAALAASPWRHRHLLASLTRRDVAGRYRGSAGGMLWSLLHPMFMLLVYTFVFGVVFKARWGMGGDSLTEFALVLFAGLMVFNLFAECANRAPGLILANANYVKKVVFPLEILPCMALGSALFHFLASLAVWLLFYLAIFGLPPATILLLPLVLMPHLLITLGVAWLLASLGTFLRDISQAVGIATTALMFLSPVFYPATTFPEKYRLLLSLNPLTYGIEQSRAVMMTGQVPAFGVLALHTAAALAFAWLGFAWFQKTRKGFADVL